MDSTLALSPVAARIAVTFPGLANAPQSTLERIAREDIYRKAPAGTLMFDEHSPCSGFPLVLAGSIRVRQCHPNGRERIRIVDRDALASLARG